jgi:serine/threonine protein kinase
MTESPDATTTAPELSALMPEATELALTEKERIILLEGIHALISQVPDICGYKLKKSTPEAAHFLKDYAYLLPTKEAAEAFVASYGDICLPFSIEISDDGYLFRVLPRHVFFAEGRDVLVKHTVALENHKAALFQAGDIFARKRVMLPTPELLLLKRAMRTKQEFEKIPHLLKGYTSMASPLLFSSNKEPQSGENIVEKCPKMQKQQRPKMSLIMPLGSGMDLFEWWKKSNSPELLSRLKDYPMLAENSAGYRFKKYAPLISASVLITLENFRLSDAAEEWVHRDIKPENILLSMSDTDPVDITTTLIDAADIAPVSQGYAELAGTLDYVGPEFYRQGYNQKKLVPISPKTDSYAVGISLLLICFDNFYKFMSNPARSHDWRYLIRNQITANRFLFKEEKKQVCYYSSEKRCLCLLKPVLPTDSPDYHSFYEKAKAIVPLLADDIECRTLAIDVLKSAFMPEVEYLVSRNPDLRDTPVIKALSESRLERAFEQIELSATNQAPRLSG